MKKIAIAITSIALSLLCMTIVVFSDKQVKPPIVQQNYGNFQLIEGMPVVPDHPLAMYGSKMAPIEQRDESVRKWLAPGVKIGVRGASGSGTIVYFDPKDNTAYVQSCGHLWNGNMSGTEAKSRNLKCEIIIWYQNEKKIPQTKTYEGTVLYYCNDRGRDSSLVKFTPDWVPDYFPIAPEGYPLKKDQQLHSVGCDGAREVAHYEVSVVGYQAARGSYQDLITKNNSPRPGRSGGGLMDDEGYYVGICWGTSDKSGNGIGLFTPLVTVRNQNKINGYDWLNEVGLNPVRRIPIKDRNNPQGQYPPDYIPTPGKK
jgi:hypothetical protein